MVDYAYRAPLSVQPMQPSAFRALQPVQRRLLALRRIQQVEAARRAPDRPRPGPQRSWKPARYPSSRADLAALDGLIVLLATELSECAEPGCHRPRRYARHCLAHHTGALGRRALIGKGLDSV